MSTPLAFRITMQVDDAGLQKATQNLRGFKNEATTANVELKGTAQQVQQAIGHMKSFGQESVKSGRQAHTTFGVTHTELRHLSSEFLVFRRLFALGALFLSPIILAGKQFIELQNAMQGVTSSLTLLGKSGVEESARYLEFVKSFTFGTAITATEGAQALGVVIDQLRGTANAENILSAARNLAIGRGIKLVEATKAITEALNGNGEALSKLTLKSKGEINELVQSGQLVKTVEKDSAEAAAVGAKTMTNFFKSQYNMTLGSVTGFISRITGFTTLKQQEDLTSILNIAGTVKKSLIALGNTPPSFKSLDDMRIRAGKLKEAIDEINVALAQSTVTPTEKKAFISKKPALEEEYDVLQKQVLVEQQQLSVERERATAEAEIAKLQTLQFFKENANYNIIQSANDVLNDRRDILKKIADAQIAEATAVANAEKAKLDIEGKRTPEAEAQIAFKQVQAIAKARETQFKGEQEARVKSLKAEEDLQKSKVTLQEFYLKNGLRIYEGISEAETLRIEDNIAQKRVAIIIAEAKREAEEKLAQGRLTAEEEVAIENNKQVEIDKVYEEGLARRKSVEEAHIKFLTSKELIQVKTLLGVGGKKAKGLEAEHILKNIEEAKKLIEARKAQKEAEEKALLSTFGGEKPLREPGRYSEELRSAVHGIATAPRAELKDVQEANKKAFVEQTKGTIDLFYSGIKNSLAKDPIIAPVKLVVDSTSLADIRAAVENATSISVRNLANKRNVEETLRLEQGGTHS